MIYLTFSPLRWLLRCCSLTSKRYFRCMYQPQMIIRCVRRAISRYRMPALAGVSAVMYIWLVVGVPLPFLKVIKDISRPFPCMHSACGCRSADQCWTTCRCHTRAEKIAWARAHGVTPPPEFKHCATRETSPSCCSGKSKSGCAGQIACVQSTGRDGHASCCSQPEDLPTPNTDVVMWQALKCSGTSLNWFAAVVALPPRIDNWQLRSICERLHVSTPVVPSAPAYPPPVPPPRFS